MNIILCLAEEIGLIESDLKEIEEYIENNEWGIALEVLCSILHQNNIYISINQYETICDLGNKMEFNDELWRDLKVCRQEIQE